MLTIKKDDIPPGEGKYVPGELGQRHGVAVYRSEDGEIKTLSSDCPHRHCNVDWNKEKKRWDCPCHGSAFSAEGNLVNGPATEDLKTILHADQGDSITIENYE